MFIATNLRQVIDGVVEVIS